VFPSENLSVEGPERRQACIGTDQRIVLFLRQIQAHDDGRKLCQLVYGPKYSEIFKSLVTWSPHKAQFPALPLSGLTQARHSTADRPRVA
jgi:hypothetical protein